jgi:hypothetical protein
VTATVKTVESTGNGNDEGNGNGNGNGNNGNGNNGNSNKVTVDPAGYRVDLLYAVNGVESDIRDTSAPFTFTNVPIGVHAIRVVKTTPPQAGSVVVSDTIVVRPGSTTAIELWF